VVLVLVLVSQSLKPMNALLSLSLLLLASILATTSAQDTSCSGIVTDGVCYTCPGGNFGDVIGGYRPTCVPLSRAPTPSLALRASLVRQATTARAPMGQSARQQRNRVLQTAETASARVTAPVEASSPSTSSTMQRPSRPTLRQSWPPSSTGTPTGRTAAGLPSSRPVGPTSRPSSKGRRSRAPAGRLWPGPTSRSPSRRPFPVSSRPSTCSPARISSSRPLSQTRLSRSRRTGSRL